MPIDLTPIANAPLPIKIHLATVLPAFALGTYLIFFSRKGAPHHRALGYLYLTLMSVTAITALFIHEVNPNGFMGFSPIHLFVPLTFFGVVGAISGARTHNVKRHRGSMIGLYIGGLLIAGSLAFMPGRVMHRVIFPATEMAAPAR
ncbi:MAG: DUF2306 domain-containing protein [Vitreimonas sp.]